MHTRELSSAYRIRLFSALLNPDNQQESWDKTLQLLSKGQQAARQAQLTQLVNEFEKGQESILEQLKSIEQFLPWELELIELGLATGNINAVFIRLREHYLLQQQFFQELKRQLKWPLLVMITVLVGVFVGIDIGIIGASIRLLVSIGIIYLLAQSVGKLCQRYRAGLLSPWLLKILRAVPGVSELIHSGQTYHYLKNLQQCTESGLVLRESLKLSAKKIPDPFFTQSFMAVYDAVNDGQKLSAALTRCGVLNGLIINTIKPPNASAVDAQQLISDAAFKCYIERLWYWARWLPQLLYVLLPFVALANLLTI